MDSIQYFWNRTSYTSPLSCFTPKLNQVTKAFVIVAMYLLLYFVFFSHIRSQQSKVVLYLRLRRFSFPSLSWYWRLFFLGGCLGRMDPYSPETQWKWDLSLTFIEGHYIDIQDLECVVPTFISLWVTKSVFLLIHCISSRLWHDGEEEGGFGLWSWNNWVWWRYRTLFWVGIWQWRWGKFSFHFPQRNLTQHLNIRLSPYFLGLIPVYDRRGLISYCCSLTSIFFFGCTVLFLGNVIVIWLRLAFISDVNAYKWCSVFRCYCLHRYTVNTFNIFMARFSKINKSCRITLHRTFGHILQVCLQVLDHFCIRSKLGPVVHEALALQVLCVIGHGDQWCQL